MDRVRSYCWELSPTCRLENLGPASVGIGHIMATRQRGSNSRGSSSKQQPGLLVVPATGPAMDMPSPAGSAAQAEPGNREQCIAVSAYLRAAQRGFAPGHELEDWLAAEREFEANGASGLSSRRQ
jgi:Protein of unknown function (DUF2934)